MGDASVQNRNYIQNRPIDYDLLQKHWDSDEGFKVVGSYEKHGAVVNVMAETISLSMEDVLSIKTEGKYVTTDVVNGGLILINKLIVEMHLPISVLSPEDLRVMLVSGVRDDSYLDQFLGIWPKDGHLAEEGASLERARQQHGQLSVAQISHQMSRRQPGSHFRLISNIGCGPGEVQIYDTLSANRNPSQLCNNDTKKLLKILCKRDTLKLIANNVQPQRETECGCLSIALASMLVVDPKSEDMFKSIKDVRKTTLSLLRQNHVIEYQTIGKPRSPKQLFTVTI